MRSFIFIASLFAAACTVSADLDVECSSSCDEEQTDCYDVCETECADASDDGDEACDTDCKTECDTTYDDCTVGCEGEG